jgi:hypothetical protein
MNRLHLAALATALALAAPAFGQGDDPIPYPDEEPTRREKPARSKPTYIRPEETQVERQDRDQVLAGLDDPNTGIGVELLAGLMLIDSSRGQWFESRFHVGARATWEYGRLFGGEVLREALFLDVNWRYALLHDGTREVFNDSYLHYFTLAPAYHFPFGHGSPFGVYLQAGGGLSYQFASLHSGTTQVQVAGIKPLIQYGIGLRGSPRLGSDGPIRIAFRLEVTRFRRGYMDDTLVGGSLGIAF